MRDMCKVFNIQKFCTNDGPGIRTTVFLKGCPLDCVWCHNPESKSEKSQLLFNRLLCAECGICISACPNHAHSLDVNGCHIMDNQKCIGCGACVALCNHGALELVGAKMTADEIIEIAMQDYAFYQASGGGITISGGEPLYFPQFTKELCTLAKEKGLHVCIETCGFSKWETIKDLLPYVDIFLWDFKESNGALHEIYTSVKNDIIIDNLRRLSDSGASVVLRCPLIPGYNDRPDHLEAIGKIAQELKNIKRIEVEPYHSLGMYKYERLGERYQLKDISAPNDKTVMEWISVISKYTDKTICKS